jgi:hypothetical protein
MDIDAYIGKVGEHDHFPTLLLLLRAAALPLRAAALLLRLLRTECAAGNATPAIRAEAAALHALLADWSANAQAHTGAEPYPIRDLVAIQTEAALRAAALNR